ncbi:MAG: NAD-binding protein [Oscillospiraceae bacterium]|jgi:trk system potassium uptake protein TrkA|nr:NAD-binding protein [Oscillospiraceae bacterium]
MSIFHREKKEKAIIVGCGRLGSQLADLLSDENQHVTILDRDGAAFRKLSSAFGGLVLEGDGSDFDMLVEAGAHDATILAVTTDDDDTNIMIGLMGKEILHIEAVVVRLNDTAKKAAIADSGIAVLSPSTLCVAEFQRLLDARKGEGEA